jgi:hypothetical protein
MISLKLCTTENNFGILHLVCAYFRIFFQPIVVAPETIDKLIIGKLDL